MSLRTRLASALRNAIATALILVTAVCSLWFVGSGCDCPPYCAAFVSNYLRWVLGSFGEYLFWVIGLTSPCGLRSRDFFFSFPLLREGAADAPTTVTVKWYPPSGASQLWFSVAPKNPQGPAPYVFENVAVPGTTGTPALRVSYQGPTSGARTLVDSFVIVTSTGSTYSTHFLDKADTSGIQAPGSSVLAPPPAVGQSVHAAADYQWALSELWYYNTQAPLNQDLCQSWMDLVGSRKAFTAVRVPVPGGMSAASTSYKGPLVSRAGTNSSPRVALLSYEQGMPPAELLTAAMELKPERLEFAENRLPGKSGEHWTVFGAAGSPQVCPNGIQIGSGKWELYSSTPLDLGGTVTPGAVLTAYHCWEGPEPPFFLRAAGQGSGDEGRIHAYPEDDVTCYGPLPLVAPGGTLPPVEVSGPNYAEVPYPARVQLHHSVVAQELPRSATFALTSSLGGTDWKLYFGSATGPDLNRPVTGVVPLQASLDIWVVGDVPAGVKGTDVVTLTVTATTHPDKPVWNTDIVMIGAWTPPDVEEHQWLPVASHGIGSNKSQWRTDLGLLNTGDYPSTAELRFHLPTGVLTRTQTVAPKEQLILTDVVNSFGSAAGMVPTATGTAALEVVASRPLKVSSRTYTLVDSAAACSPRGTFGQGYDATTSEAALSSGQVAWLTQLTENAAYRTNISLTNTGTVPAGVTVGLLNGAGVQIGTYQVPLAPGEYKQENRPFATKAGQVDMARGYARILVTAGSGVIAIASVVNNVTNDPTTLPAIRTASSRSWVQVASHAGGDNQSQWRTDLGVLNTATQPANVEIRFHKAGGTTSSSVPVAAGQQAILADVVGQIPESGSAGLEVQADRPVLVSSRTYNQVASTALCYPGGTFGQNYDAYLTTRTLAAGAMAYLPQLQENAAYRTNIALTNSGTTAAKVTVTLHDGSGAQVGQYTVDLAPGQYKQENKPFATKAGRTNLAAGYAKVTVTQGSGIIASASVVDNLTNDPTTMPAI